MLGVIGRDALEVFFPFKMTVKSRVNKPCAHLPSVTCELCLNRVDRLHKKNEDDDDDDNVTCIDLQSQVDA